MKKSGFTLAEVLITLGIIGFIAAITLPSLTTATTDKQSASALKKSLNSLTNIAQISQAADGIDFGNIETINEFIRMVRKHGNVEQDLIALPNSSTGMLDGQGDVIIENGPSAAEYTDAAANQALMFRDGTMIIFPGEGTGIAAAARQADDETGEVRGFTILVDVNGRKGPNRLSSCLMDLDGNCSALSDRFSVRVKGNVVVPVSRASRWLAQR